MVKSHEKQNVKIIFLWRCSEISQKSEFWKDGYCVLKHVYMRLEVNSNWFEILNRFEIAVYMAIYMEISLPQLSKQWQGSNAHVQMISFNYCKLN